MAKRQKRAYLKRFSSATVNTGSRVARHLLNPKKGSEEEKEPWFAYNQRAKSVGLQGPVDAVHAEMGKLFIDRLTISLKDGQPHPTRFITKNSPRGEMLQKIEKLEQSAFFQKVQAYHFVYYLKEAHIKLKLYFAGTEYFWVSENTAKNKWRRSIIYPSKEFAVKAFKNEKITWVEEAPLTFIR